LTGKGSLGGSAIHLPFGGLVTRKGGPEKKGGRNKKGTTGGFAGPHLVLWFSALHKKLSKKKGGRKSLSWPGPPKNPYRSQPKPPIVKRRTSRGVVLETFHAAQNLNSWNVLSWEKSGTGTPGPTEVPRDAVAWFP